MATEAYPNAEHERRDGPVKLSEPKKIGFYSIGPQKNYMDDFSQLKYINCTYEGVDVNFDLNHNINQVQERVSVGGAKLKFMQLFLKEHKDCLDVLDSSAISLNEVPFVASQGLFREVTCFQYENEPPYRVTACLFRGVLYISRLWPKEKQENWPKKHVNWPKKHVNWPKKQENWPKKRNHKSSWGHKFEQYMLSGDPTREPETEAPVDETSHFAVVFEAFLNKHRLVYSGQMSGLLAEGIPLGEGFQPHKHSNHDVLEEIKKLPFAKLNTCIRINNKYQDDIFRSTKMLQWWLQGTYLGVKTILCGVRNDKLGIVERVDHYKTDDLPKDNEIFWDPDRCMDFCDRFLTFVKQSFEEEIILKHPGSVDNVRHLPMILLAFEMRSEDVSTPDEFCLTERLPNESLRILGAEFMEMFTDQ